MSEVFPTPYQDNPEVLRKYAEFHRRLGGLLGDLTDEAEVYWTGTLLRQAFGGAGTRFANTATGHELYPDEATRNVYHKAIYVISDAEPYKPVLARLKAIQEEVMGMTGAARPYDGLLEPVLLEDVRRARLRSQETHLQRKLKASSLLNEVRAKLAGVKQNARAFEAVSLQDEATERLHAEIAHLEEVAQALETLDATKLLVRKRHLRVLPTVYVGDERARQVYVRDVGLILCGPRVATEIPPSAPKTRSDKVTDAVIAPLLSFDDVTVYLFAAWQAAVQGDEARDSSEK